MLRLNIHRLVLLGFIMLAPLVVVAEDAHDKLDPVGQLISKLAQVNSLLVAAGQAQTIGELTAITPEQVDDAEVQAWAEAQKNTSNKSTGLELRLGYDRKFGSGSEDIYDELYSYKNRFNAMLSWNILQSGFIARGSNNLSVELESKMLTLELQSVLSKEQILSKSQLQSHILDAYSNNLLLAKIDVYNSLISLLESLYAKGQVLEIELAEAKMNKLLIQGELCGSQLEFKDLFASSDYLSKQVLVSEQMIDSLIKNSNKVEQSELERKLLNQQQQTENYWHKVSVSPYLKAQHYSDSGFSSSRVTANIGISAVLPIGSGAKFKRKELEARSLLASSETQRITRAMVLTVSDLSSELNNNLERLTALVELEQLCLEQIKVAHKAYSHKQLNAQGLSEYYIKLLTHKQKILDVVAQREQLKTKLLLTSL